MFGYPLVIVSDNGPAFRNSMMEHMATFFGYRHVCRDIRRDICLFSPNMYMRDSVRQSDLCVSAIGIADCVLSCMFLGFSVLFMVSSPEPAPPAAPSPSQSMPPLQSLLSGMLDSL